MSGFFFNQSGAASRFEGNFWPGSATGFSENLIAGHRDQMARDNLVSRRLNLEGAYGPIVERLRHATGDDRIRNPYGEDFAREAALRETATPGERLTIEGGERDIWDRITIIRETDPEFLMDLARDPDDLRARIHAGVLEIKGETEDVTRRQTTMGAVGEFLGRAGAAISDPPVLVSLFLGAPAASGILRIAATEALIGAGTEAVIQPAVAAYRRELGLNYTAADFWRNVGFASAGGALFGGAVAGSLRGISKVADRFPGEDALRAKLEAVANAATPEQAADAMAALTRRELIRVYDKVVESPTAEQQAARDMLGDVDRVEGDNPLGDTPAGQAEHAARFDAALEAAALGRAPAIADRPGHPVEVAPAAPPADGMIVAVDPAEIGVDAKLFQFKEGGDDAGVTDRLAGVTQWDPVKAGVALVYEFQDGRKFIADGHQRLALAQRIAEADPGQRPRLNAIILREADDISPDEARVIAAMKNIAEGTGTAVDAAKVLRVDPNRLTELPPRSAIVRQARDLLGLDDEAFALVVNEVVTANHAALVGRLAPLSDTVDGPLQIAMLQQLGRAAPANQFEAEAMVRQLMAIGGDRRTQASLFGDEVVFDSLLKERAQVLDRAQKKLRRDRDVFSTLTRDRDRIEAEGNRLDAEGNRLDAEINQRTAQDAAHALEILQILAARRGPIADALNAAARRARDDNLGDAVDDFVGSVRRSIESGDFDGVPTGGAGRADQAQGQGAAILDDAVEPARGGPGGLDGDTVAAGPGADAARLEPFSEPGGAGQADQVAALERDVAGVDTAEGPTLRLSDAEEAGLGGPASPGELVYAIDLPDQPNAGHVLIERIEDGVAHIGDIIFGTNQLGPRNVRALLRRLRSLNPEIRSVAGERVSGARQGGRRVGLGEGEQVRVDVGTDDGNQAVIPGAERITDRELAERGLEGRQSTDTPQQPADDGLFDLAQRNQVDLLDEIPVGRAIDDAGDTVAETRPLGELLQELDDDAEFLEALNLCNPKAA